MNKFIKICNITLIATLALVALVSILAFFDTNTVSETENRALAEKPEFTLSIWFDGDYSLLLEDFLSDHVYGRNKLIKLTNKIENIMRLPTKVRFIN